MYTRRCTLYAARELRKNASRASSRPRDNGKMNAKWRTQRHLSIRDLDWRSLFLRDSSFHAIDDHTGLHKRSGSSFLLFFFLPLLLSFLSFSFETVTQQSSILRPWCAAELELLCSEEVFLPSRLSAVSHERVYSCLLRRMILSEYYSAAGTVSLGFPVFPALIFLFFFIFLFPRQPRNLCNRQNIAKYLLSKFLHI